MKKPTLVAFMLPRHSLNGSPEMNALAQHTLIDFHGCDAQVLASADALRPLVMDAVIQAGGTIVTDVFHGFSPHGVSGVVVIAESHVAIHTWPEHRFAAVDVFSCSPRLDPLAIETSLALAMRSESTTRRVEARGPVTA